ncbi:MAG: hypothetical protein AAB439_03080 [Patescibacteria group bacterium]
MKKWVVRHKNIGETPLQVVEKYRKEAHLAPDVPLAYAGRLDPMADGKLLIIIGDECKVQEKYHGLDKAYRFQILFGFRSDTGDILGLATPSENPKIVLEKGIGPILSTFIGEQSFPYPLFSSRPVKGKPLHQWTLEGRLNEIEIPTKTSSIYTLRLEKIETKMGATLYKEILEKINSIPQVTDPRKALGADFRREPIRARWGELLQTRANDEFSIATLYCESSSGTYMRTLAEEIAKRLNTFGLAYAITRTKIGSRLSTPFGGVWYRSFN